MGMSANNKDINLSNKICAGVVTYNPDINLLRKNISILIPQVNEVLVIDNNSINHEELVSLCNEFELKIILNDMNYGIAYALNQLLTYSYENNYEWYLTMDQDSICDIQMIGQYEKVLKTLDYTPAILSPFILNNNKIMLSEYQNIKENLCAVNVIQDPMDCITSGALTNVSASKSVKGYNNHLFIDCVDFDFNIALMEKNKILRVNTTYLIQQMGKAKRVNFFHLVSNVYSSSLIKKLKFTPVYNLTRIYYIFRNSTYIRKNSLSNSKRVSFSWMFGQFLYYFFTYPLSYNRIKLAAAAYKGVKDYKKVKNHRELD